MNSPHPHQISKLEGYLLGNGCILLAAIFWGVNVSFTKALIPEWMSADSISVVRLIGGCILFWLTSIFVKCEPIEREDWLKLILGGAVGLFAFIYLLILSLRYANAIDVSIIMTLPPMFVIVIEILFLHSRPKMLEYIGVVISFIGAVIVIVGGASKGGQSSDFLLGIIIAICSTICYAFYLVIMAKPSHKYRPLSLLRWVFLFSALPALALLPGIQNEPILHCQKWIPWSEIAFILFGPTFIAYFLLQPAIKMIGSELCSLYQYLIPVFAALSAELMGLEKLNLMQVCAMSVIIAGMILTNLGKRKRKKEMLARKKSNFVKTRA